jgi:iron(II)-dependent oxidoreductase
LGCRCDGDSKIHTPWWEKWSKSEEGKAIIASSGNTASVAKFRGDLSAYGCYDMGGNVAEWVGDWFRTDYYKKSAKRNPTGPTEEEAENVKEGQKELGSCRVWRGGYWYSPRHSLRASYRYRLVPPYRSNYIGFRCARTLTP